MCSQVFSSSTLIFLFFLYSSASLVCCATLPSDKASDDLNPLEEDNARKVTQRSFISNILVSEEQGLNPNDTFQTSYSNTSEKVNDEALRAVEVKNTPGYPHTKYFMGQVEEILGSMIEQLSQFTERFSLRFIKMTDEHDLRYMSDLMSDFDVAGDTPLFFLAGGLKKLSNEPLTEYSHGPGNDPNDKPFIESSLAEAQKDSKDEELSEYLLESEMTEFSDREETTLAPAEEDSDKKELPTEPLLEKSHQEDHRSRRSAHDQNEETHHDHSDLSGEELDEHNREYHHDKDRSKREAWKGNGNVGTIHFPLLKTDGGTTINLLGHNQYSATGSKKKRNILYQDLDFSSLVKEAGLGGYEGLRATQNFVWAIKEMMESENQARQKHAGQHGLKPLRNPVSKSTQSVSTTVRIETAQDLMTNAFESHKIGDTKIVEEKVMEIDDSTSPTKIHTESEEASEEDIQKILEIDDSDNLVEAKHRSQMVSSPQEEMTTETTQAEEDNIVKQGNVIQDFEVPLDSGKANKMVEQVDMKKQSEIKSETGEDIKKGISVGAEIEATPADVHSNVFRVGDVLNFEMEESRSDSEDDFKVPTDVYLPSQQAVIAAELPSFITPSSEPIDRPRPEETIVKKPSHRIPMRSFLLHQERDRRYVERFFEI